MRPIYILPLSIVFILSSHPNLDAQSNGFVHTRGRHIVAPDGQTIQLRGINLGNWLVPEGYMFQFRNATSPKRIEDVVAGLLGPDESNAFWNTFRDRYITRDDIRYIRTLGMNVVRVPFNYRLFSPEELPDVRISAGFDMLDRVVSWCREEGLYVILDMHCAPGGQTGDNIDDSWGYPFLFESAASQDRVVAIWTEIAHRYATEQAVAGYDLLNEPIATYFDAERLNPRLEPLYKRIVAAIRTVDTNHTVFLGGAQWDTNFRVFGPPFDRNLVYTFHKYWMPPVQASIQEYIDFRERFDVPVWMGESGENTDSWVDSFRVVLEQNDIGWCFWTYKRLGATRCVRQIARPSGWDQIITYADHPRGSYAAIRDMKVDRVAAKGILDAYLDAVSFEKCTPNDGYIRALGLEPQR